MALGFESCPQQPAQVELLSSTLGATVDCPHGGGRARARPRKRWEDDFMAFLKSQGKESHWTELAHRFPDWLALEEEFVSFFDGPE